MITLSVFTISSKKKLSDRQIIKIHRSIIGAVGKNNLIVIGSRKVPVKEEKKFWKLYNNEIKWSKK